MIKFLRKQKIQFYIFLGILVLGVFLRFYNYPYRYSLGEETIRDAVIGIEGARELQFPLTGSFSSLGPFTFGPWYAYQLIIFHLIFPFVYSPWLYLSIISVAYIFIMYKIGKILGGDIFALVLAFLVAISPAQIISATHLTSHNNTNLFAVLSIWIFLTILSRNKSKWWHFLLGFIIGIGMNLHFQMGGLLILPLTLLVSKRKYVNFVFSGFGVICSFIPMLIFEMNNHWFTTKNIFIYLTIGKNAMYVPNRWLFYVRDFWPSFWGDALGVPPLFAGAVILLSMFFLVRLAFKKKLSKNLLLIIIAFLFNFILLRYYWGPRFFGYLNFLRPFVFIFTTFAIVNLKYKKIFLGAILIILIIFFSAQRTFDELKYDPFSKTIYQAVDDLENKYPNKKFALYSCSLEYHPYYNSSAYSILFALELEHKFDSKGIKIGLEKDCNFPEKQVSINGVLITTKNPPYPVLSNIGLVDFSKAPDSAILKAGWTAISFRGIYDSYARWWFKMQP